MKTIWKFKMPISDSVICMMPVEAKFLSLQVQNGVVCAWFLVDSDAPLTKRKFVWHGTGRTIRGEVGEYVGTIQQECWVWHLFEITS